MVARLVVAPPGYVGTKRKPAHGALPANHCVVCSTRSKGPSRPAKPLHRSSTTAAPDRATVARGRHHALFILTPTFRDAAGGAAAPAAPSARTLLQEGSGASGDRLDEVGVRDDRRADGAHARSLERLEYRLAKQTSGHLGSPSWSPLPRGQHDQFGARDFDASSSTGGDVIAATHARGDRPARHAPGCRIRAHGQARCDTA